MILEALMSLLVDFLDLLLTPIHISSLPPGVDDIMETGLGYIQAGLGIIASFCHLSYILTLFGIVIIIDVAMVVYKFVRWILQKIPMASVE